MSPLYRRIGAYEIRGEIGGGGMADVFVAEDARNGRTVALKVPRRDPEIRRAERAGALLQRLLAEQDSRVAQVYEAGEDEGIPFVAMEYIAGQDLSERIAGGPLEPAEAIRIAVELCDLLAVAHECPAEVDGCARRGIVHGDLKPRNIRLQPDGRVRVVDFGIAKALSETRRLTQNEFGSLAYSSPERVDTGTVDAQSDLWALAVVLYETLTGAPPFRAATPRQLEQLLLGRTRPARLPAGCPRALDVVLRKAFAPRLGDRYASAAAFRADLDCVLAGIPTVAEQALGRGDGEGPAAEAALRAAGNGASAGADATARGVDEPTRRSAAVAGPAPEATARTAMTGAVADDATRRSGAADDATRHSAAADDATRRSAAADDATRRTSAGAAAAAMPGAANGPVAVAGAAPAATSAAAAAPAAPARRRGLRAIAKRAAVAAVLFVLVNEFFVIRAAGELGSRLPTYGRSDANRAWYQYRRIDRRSLLRIGAWGVAGRVKNWHVAESDALIADYLSDTPTIRERGWKQAEALLQRAAIIAPNDSRVRARLRYCQGQLARINGEALLERRGSGAHARFNEARRALEEAARLRGRWPDPHLGLARVHAIGFGDVDQTQEALRDAERAGYRLGDREVALLADAHRMRAERMLTAVPGLPDEPRYLERIRDDCERALELYDQVPAYGQVSGSIRRVHVLLERVDAREGREISPVPGFREQPDPASVDTAESTAWPQ
jgi:predicted Ser/Thr protein kinase